MLNSNPSRQKRYLRALKTMKRVRGRRAENVDLTWMAEVNSVLQAIVL
jgi:hypothetical protein